jgi:hypothetical protein
MEIRSSLPQDVRGWRWMKWANGKKWEVAAFPVNSHGLILPPGHPDRVHMVGREDGQIMTDLTAPLALGLGWIGTSEAEASQIDMELVNFVQRLGLEKNTAPRHLNGGY